MTPTIHIYHPRSLSVCKVSSGTGGTSNSHIDANESKRGFSNNPMPPTPSRYESYYRGTKKNEEGAVDVNAVLSSEENKDQDNDGSGTTNPFFVGYAQEELMALWEIHRETIGERKVLASEDGNNDRDRQVMGGLHELILEATRSERVEDTDESG